jgi:uroporphyrinogen decarboxylase
LLSIKVFRERVLPYYKHGLDWVRQHTRRNVKLHSRPTARIPCFWSGSADCQQTLAFGAPEGVAREVETDVRALAPGGGLVWTSVHNIETGVPPENVLAV